MPIPTKNDLLLEREGPVFDEEVLYRPSVPFRWMRTCPWCTATLTVETLMQPWICLCGWSSADKVFDGMVKK